MLLDDRYVLEERTEGAELADKVCLLDLLNTNGSKNCSKVILILILNYFNAYVSLI